MKTIIGREEKVRRQREKRRAAGMKPRAEYEEQSHEKLKPWVAEGISRAWWYKKRSRL